MEISPRKPVSRALVWFRRDLRVADHPALAAALRDADQVWCAFVLDKAILDDLPADDRRVAFIRASLADLDGRIDRLSRGGASLIVRHADPSDEIPRLAAQLDVQAVYFHRDDDPVARARDARVYERLRADGRAMHGFKDHVIFERKEILTGGGTPYGVFTPYKNAWLKALHARPELLGDCGSDVDGAALAAAPPSPWRDGAARGRARAANRWRRATCSASASTAPSPYRLPVLPPSPPSSTA